jgi:flagellar hook-basal body complex protein FliE
MLPLVSLAATAVAPLAETAATALAPAAHAAAGGVSFGDVLQQLATQTVDSLKNGEATAVAAVDGGASAQKVVSAVMQAERDLHTAVALRDKAVSAYQEISRMAI